MKNFTPNLARLNMKLLSVLLLCLSLMSQAQKRTPLYTGLEVSYLALNVADVVTTTQFLKAGGVELNPLMKPIVNNLPILVLVKSAGAVGSLAILRSVYKDRPKVALAGLIMLNLGLSYVVYNNYQLTLSLRI